MTRALRVLGIVWLLWLSGCAAGPRAACYASNDARYWQTVEECRAAGHGAECPALAEADIKLAEADEACP